jgi:hypothetical protein
MSNEFNHNYPQELAEQSNFVVFRLEKGKEDKVKKVPYSPLTTKKCSVTDPTAWSDLQTSMWTQFPQKLQSGSQGNCSRFAFVHLYTFFSLSFNQGSQGVMFMTKMVRFLINSPLHNLTHEQSWQG